MAITPGDIGPYHHPVNRNGLQRGLQSGRARALDIFKRTIQNTGIGKDTDRKQMIASLDREIEKLEQWEALQNGLIAEGTVVSEPRRINREILLTPDYTIAPSDEALTDVKSKMPDGDKAKEHVEAILQSILQAEDLAHALYVRQENYRGLGNKIKLRTYHDDGSFAADVVYLVKKIETTAGLNAFILTPENAPKGITPEVKMIFVGTKDFPGLKRDFEKGAAGNQSFEGHQDVLLKSLDEAVGSVASKDVQISVIGHSLGGVDAQRMVLKITQVINSDSALRDKNISLRLETVAAPGLTKEQCLEFAENLKMATILRDDKPCFEFRATVVIYSLDPISACGKQHIMANPEVLSLCAQANVVQIKLDPFQHESGIFKNTGVIRAGGVQIFQTPQRTLNNEEQRALHTTMTHVLNRSLRIDIL